MLGLYFSDVYRFRELGGNFLDTANRYSRGESERVIGNWLSQQERHEIILATKVGFAMDETDPNGDGLSRNHIMYNIEQSLKRLQTNYIDLYYIHRSDSNVPAMETLTALNDLVRSGKVRYIGASNLTGWQLQKYVDLQDKYGFAPFVALQQQYSLLERMSEVEVTKVCENEGIGFLPWSPLKGGLLTGKYSRYDVDLPSNTRLGWVAADPQKRSGPATPNLDDWRENDQAWSVIAGAEAIGKAHNKTTSQVALRWLLQRKPVTSVVIGARNIHQLDENMVAGTGWKISSEEMDTLNQLSATKLYYPYNWMQK